MSKGKPPGSKHTKPILNPSKEAVNPERMPTGEIDFGLSLIRIRFFAKMAGIGITLVSAC
jgi:hypothetical protein